MDTERTMMTSSRDCRWRLRLGIALLPLVFYACKGASGESKAGAGGADKRPVSVVTAKVVTRDVPVTLDGLGTVTAYKTVTVRSQVDGRLDSVAFREGQLVKRGTLLALIDPRPFAIQLHQAEGALARDQAQLGGSKVNLDRYSRVAKDKLIPQQQADDQGTLVGQLEGSVKADQAQIEQAKLMLEYAHIRSPIDGVTGVRLVDPGNMVHPSEAGGIVVVTQVDPIAVLFTLPQDELPRVQKALAEGKPAVDALSRDGSSVLATGTLEVIDNQINATTATIRLKAIFPNSDRVLWPNQFVKARLHLGLRKGALVVPAVAVQRGPAGAFAYVVGADKTVAARPVVVDSTDTELAVIRSGLTPGETVVTEGQFQLKPGALVESREKSKPDEGREPAGRQGQGAGKASGPAREAKNP
jgi:multidrug efflux system membrane fusion protein